METDNVGRRDRQEIVNLVISAISDANQIRMPDEQLEESADAPLFGDEGKLDSIGLVTLLLDVEELLDENGIVVSLSSEHAMSQRNSPYRSVASLVDYILLVADDDA